MLQLTKLEVAAVEARIAELERTMVRVKECQNKIYSCDFVALVFWRCGVDVQPFFLCST